MRHRLMTVLTAVSLMVAATPARADAVEDRFASPFGPRDGQVPTAKKVVTLTFIGVSAAAFASSFVFLFQANGAESDRRALMTPPDPTGGIGAQCRTPADCDRAIELKADRDAARDRWTTAMLVGGGAAAAAFATLLLWPNAERDKPVSLTPRVNPAGGGFVLEGRF
jgi:hypothetical protein